MSTGFRTDSVGASSAISSSTLTSLASSSTKRAEDTSTATIPNVEATLWSGDIARGVSINAQASSTQTAATTPIDRKTLAVMAADVYDVKSSPPAGFREANAKDLSAIGLKPENLKSNDGDFKARVYVEGSGSNARYVVSMRGSRPTALGDWVANAQQGAGLNSVHYSKALSIGESIARSGNRNVTITGHSLGGGLASAAAIASGRDATTFNASGLSNATIRKADSIRTGITNEGRGNVDALYVKGELLSSVQDGGDRKIGAAVGDFILGLGSPLAGRTVGKAIGGAIVNLPEAYGKRIMLDPVRPQGMSASQDNPVARHMMDYVSASLNGR